MGITFGAENLAMSKWRDVLSRDKWIDGSVNRTKLFRVRQCSVINNGLHENMFFLVMYCYCI